MRNVLLASVALAPVFLATLTPGCADDDAGEPVAQQSCVQDQLAVGDDLGHADPFGAKAAGEARAARLLDVSQVPQPAHGRQRIEDGDFILINDKIAVVIEDGGLSDSYARFGGEILAIDAVGDDGKPLGLSMYGETLIGIGFTMPDPTSVSVLRDGSDGGEAVVRVIGRTKTIPFLDGPLSAVANSDFDLEVAYDYLLAPGEERVVVRISVVNPDAEDLDLGELKTSSDEMVGFFHTNRNQMVTPELGFAAEGEVSWVGFVNDDWSFAWRSLVGPMEHGIEVSGFHLFTGPGFLVPGCAISSFDRAELIAGGPYYDGLREAVRRVDDAPAWRAIGGTVSDGAGSPMASAWVHVIGVDGTYLSRVKSAADGTYLVHAPDETVELVAQQRGYVHAGVDVAAGESSADLQFDPHAQLHVTAAEQGSGTALPVRVQVIPVTPPPAALAAGGVADERNGRLHQDFAVTGDTTLVVPPGEHRVIVSRGYEYELHDETVTVIAGETAEVSAVLERSVDSTGVMCADFHIHSFMSVDSTDPIEHKVRGAIADGLDIPVSSEHQWVVDFSTVIDDMGLSAWAFGMPSQELTTFLWGHFGVVPLLPRPGEHNNGAIDWIGRSPAEVFAAVDERPERPALIINHPSNSGFGSYFSTVVLDKVTAEPAYPDLWSDNFDAVEVFNDSDFDKNRGDSVAHWFALLNQGMRVFAVGNSDSHHLRSSPVGYPRTCLWFGHDDPTALSNDTVRDALIAGGSTISGGLLMTALGPAGERPGEDVAAGSVTFMVTVESPSWTDALDLEVIVNGVTVSTEGLLPLGNGTSNRYVNEVTLDVTAGDWVLFHARGDGDLAPLHPGRGAFAVSNPFFVQ